MAAALALSAGACGSSGPGQQTVAGSTSVPKSQIKRTACEVSLNEKMAASLAAYVQSSAEGSRVVRRIQFELGVETNEYRAYQIVFSSVFPRLRTLGLQQANSEAAILVESECLSMYPDITTTTSGVNASVKTLPPLVQPGDSAGTAGAPSAMGASCLHTGFAIIAVECAIGAWRSNNLHGSDLGFLTRDSETTLVNTPPPSSITPAGCTVISSSRSIGEYEYEDDVVLECAFALDGDRTLKFTVADGGIGRIARITSIVIGTK